MLKNYVLDTNVLVHDPLSIYSFSDNNIIIPLLVIEELDNLKKRDGILGFHARNAAREINKLRQSGNLLEGVKLPGGGTLRIEMDHMNADSMPDGLDLSKNDNKLLTITWNLQQKDKDIPTIMVTKDVYMSIKGDSLGIRVEDYENDKVTVDEIYKGYLEVKLSSSDIEKIYGNGLKPPRKIKEPLYPNQFLQIKSVDNTSHEGLAIFDGKKIVPLKYANSSAWGLTPLNMEQKMAFELLMDNNIHFVSLAGGAGSGKTILSTAVALQKVIEEGVFRKIIFVKPVVAAGNDIGFLPGTEQEKLKPWMGSFYDAVDNLFGTRAKKKEKSSKGDNSVKSGFSVEGFIDQYREQGVIDMKTFNYMRGRTLCDSLVIVDEAQEITPHLAKLMLTRAGFGSKFVFLGDPTDSQIDNVLVDERSNGLVYTIEKMKQFEISGHVTLSKVERSPLAKIAERYM
ncbi:PhoH family protein [Lutispora sp.]|uniref:PhoH family protein n=1 Tax=Lutispora sp. TaxID=2828727 RepID=UPI000EC5E9EA|nr:PhoH family protein [Lutispora sp.]MEA4961492.1 PhoH family protein [Lutispora sp.]HCJ57944.1 phosphate starvation-inducible protein PhoH [Clostridiaceae bacterium]